MNKNKLIAIGLVIAGLTMGVAMVCIAGFVDTFSNGRVTDSGATSDFWKEGTYSGENTSSISEAVGGPLKLRYFGNLNIQGGPRLYSRVSSEFDFFAHPVSLTVAAAPNCTLTPVKGTPSSAVDGAWTYLGLTPMSGPGLTDGPDRIVLQLSDRNVLQFSIKDSANGILYIAGVFSLPSDARVKKMTLYLDGTDEAHDNFYINFGVQYADSNGTMVNYSRFLTPFNLGYDKGYGGAKTQAQLDKVKASYSGGAAAQIQLLNCQP